MRTSHPSAIIAVYFILSPISLRFQPPTPSLPVPYASQPPALPESVPASSHRYESLRADSHSVCCSRNLLGQIATERLVLVTGDIDYGGRRTTAAISCQGWARSCQYHAADVGTAATSQKQLYVTSDSGRLNLDLMKRKVGG